MKAPLPQETVKVLRQNEGRIDNLFLLFYRYVWTWRPNWEMKGPQKQKMMRKVARKAGKDSPAAPYLNNFRERQQQLLAALGAEGWAVPPEPLLLETDARLIAGLGYKGALEVGITLHPLYGFPYLPASSIKGVARAYAELVDGSADEATIAQVFGSPAKAPDRADEFRVGAVRFFDALPTRFPKLEVDVMTPHFGPYYRDGEPPGDWHDPNPVPFLTVAEGQPFQFFLAARDGVPLEGEGDSIPAEECLALASKWLKVGLEHLGAGGKTAAGYGFFQTSEERQAERSRLQRLQRESERAQKEARRKAGERRRREREAREAAEAAQRERKAREAEEARQREEEATRAALEPVPDGWHAGAVKKLRPTRETGNIELEDGSPSVPFRFSDLHENEKLGEGGINEGSFVLFRLTRENNQRRAVDVRIRRDTRRAG